MIVLDEELQGLGLEQAIAHWYRGAVLVVKQLRPGTVIKDEAIPTLLRRANQPTFVTIKTFGGGYRPRHRSVWCASS